MPALRRGIAQYLRCVRHRDLSRALDEQRATVDTAGKVLNIIEKPKQPVSNLAVIGIYMFDARVFEFISRLEPSARGELEITDVNNFYIEDGSMTSGVLDGWWTDAGTVHSLHRAANLLAGERANPVLAGHVAGAVHPHVDDPHVVS